MSRALKLCHVPHFGGGGYQVTMKPIEPQGHSSIRNKISEYYDISQNTTVLINPWLVNTRISKYHSTVLYTGKRDNSTFWTVFAGHFQHKPEKAGHLGKNWDSWQVCIIFNTIGR